MKYPERIEDHISESASFKALAAALPSRWIIRELTERDYGIDLYVEIVSDAGEVSGDLVALQVKSKTSLTYDASGQHIFNKIKKTTINYWLGLPVPVFFIAYCRASGGLYWSSVESNEREGQFIGDTKTCSLRIEKKSDFSKAGLSRFMRVYSIEKKWSRIENAIEKSLMAYNTLGPLILMCLREEDEDQCSSTVQYMLIQHYEYFVVLSDYFSHRSERIEFWRERNKIN
jgi:hypothetical protein